jgi:hypothetical protein
LSLISGAALERVKPTLWAKPSNAFTAATCVDGRGARRLAVGSDPHRLKRRLNVIDGRVRRAVGMRFQPDGEEFVVGPGRRVQGRQPFGIRTSERAGGMI